MLDERVGKSIQHENCIGRVRKSWTKSLIGIKLSSNTKFPHPTRFSVFSQILRSAKPIQHFIQHGKNAMLDEMLDWFASAFNDIFERFIQTTAVQFSYRPIIERMIIEYFVFCLATSVRPSVKQVLNPELNVQT